MRHWFKDRHFRSLLKNSGYLAASRVVATIAQIVTVSLAAHALGLMMFGALILIDSYARAVSGLANFQSWQLIVRYGSRALLGEHDQFRASTGFAFALDMISGFGGFVVAVALLPFLASWVGIQPDLLTTALLYCTILPTMASATPTGVLRALDRFDLISWQATASPISRALMVTTAFFLEAPMIAYVGAWYASTLFGNLFCWFLAWREMRRRSLIKGVRPTLRPNLPAGAWRFAIQVNLTASVQAASGPIARLVVGGLLGPAGTALFRVASVLTESATRPADMLAKAFYPEVVRMDISSKGPWKLMLRGAALASAVALLAIFILLLGGKQIVAFMFGEDFVGAYEALVILMIVPLLSVLSFPLPPMLYALDRPDGPLKARLAGTALYFLLIAPLCWSFGVNGAAIAFVTGNATTAAVMAWQLRREHRRVRRPQAG